MKHFFLLTIIFLLIKCKVKDSSISRNQRSDNNKSEHARPTDEDVGIQGYLTEQKSVKSDTAVQLSDRLVENMITIVNNSHQTCEFSTKSCGFSCPPSDFFSLAPNSSIEISNPSKESKKPGAIYIRCSLNGTERFLNFPLGNKKNLIEFNDEDLNL